ncbi:MAG: hypothetical protein H7144_16535 [Burkholderiales bacterium]|nr:hypothetical protein [Phycisphaerae bacterium]
MTVTVDSQALPVDELGLQTLGDVLTHLQTHNRLVTHVLIDGRAPDLEHVPQLRRRSLLGHTVFIETTEPRQIALDVLDEIHRQMDEAETARMVAIDHLSVGEPNKALQKLSGCFTTWQAAQDAIQKVAQLLRVDLDLIRVEDVSLSSALQAFAEQLRTVRGSLESRDFVTLSDTLQYEISHTIRQWRDALAQLRAIVA